MSFGAPPTPGGFLAQITMDTKPGRAIPATFMGIDLEPGRSSGILGSSEVGINTTYRKLVSNLTSYGSGPIIMRIGGDGTDHERWVRSATSFAEFAKATGAHFILGVNLGANDVGLAVDQTKTFVRQMPAHSLDAIEIGNEPYAFVHFGYRKPPYTFKQYFKEFDLWRAKILPLLPAGTRLAGPVWSHYSDLADAKPFLDAEHSYLYGFTFHVYATGGATCTSAIPLNALLRPEAASFGPSQVKSAVSLTHGYNLPFRLDELGAISSCAGYDGVSNTFGSALWAIDIMFEFANVGVDGINWYSSNLDLDSPFDFTVDIFATSNSFMNPAGKQHLKRVNPLYYAMLFFQAATGRQAHLLPVSVKTQENIKAWATMDGSGVPRLVVINKTSNSGSIRVDLSGFRTASIRRLTAPSISSKNGVTFAGQTMDGSTDGSLLGTRKLESLNSSSGVFNLPMGAYSAALVEFSH